MINVSLTGAHKLEGGPKLIRAAARRSAKKGAEVYTTAIHDWIRQGRAFDPQTGLLQDSIGWRGDGQGGLVYAQSEVAEYLEFGTDGPYLIAPRRRKALRWGSRSQGGYRFSSGVMHPGIPAGKFAFFYTDMAARRRLVTEAAREQYATDIEEGLS